LIDSIEAVPNDCDLVLAVLDHDGLHALEFPCPYIDPATLTEPTGKFERGGCIALNRTPIELFF
jgi:hypothetical protein